MNGFIDLHCHLLPALDDGPQLIEETLDMLRIAQTEGVTHIVATPHYAPQIPGFHAPWNDSVFRQVKAAAERFGIRVHAGSEIRLDGQALDALERGLCKPLGYGRHVLLELPEQAVPARYHAWMTDFVAKGWVPVLAHAERLKALQENPHAMDEWLEDGCLLQVNAASLLGHWSDKTARTARKLVRAKLCHAVATDAHSSGRRAPVVRDAYRKVEKWMGKAHAQSLFVTAPSHILGLPERNPSHA